MFIHSTFRQSPYCYGAGKAEYTDPSTCSSFKYCIQHPTFPQNQLAGYGGYTRPTTITCSASDSYGSSWRSAGNQNGYDIWNVLIVVTVQMLLVVMV